MQAGRPLSWGGGGAHRSQELQLDRDRLPPAAPQTLPWADHANSMRHPPPPAVAVAEILANNSTNKMTGNQKNQQCYRGGGILAGR